MTPLLLWRHPKPTGAAGRCIGSGTDLRVDPRRARRLARRIATVARRELLPRVVWCSPLRRCRAVAHHLRRLGFKVRVDARLAELHFGTWEGQPWSAIPRGDIDAWVADFAHHAPGGGESLTQLLRRLAEWRREQPSTPALLVISHAGVMQSLAWQAAHPARLPTATEWGLPPRYGELRREN